MADSVCVGYLHPGQVDTHFHTSFLNMVLYDRSHHYRLTGYLAEECASGMVAWGRNRVVRTFLEQTKAEWLFFIDSDMGFEPDIVDRLLASADKRERPIMGALAFGQLPVEDGRGPLGEQRYRKVPTIYRLTEKGMRAVEDYPRDAVVECDGTGAACLLIHRSALKRMLQEFSGPMHWFDTMALDGGFFGEDLTFCMRAKALKIPIHVDTRVKTSHRKVHYLVEESGA